MNSVAYRSDIQGLRAIAVIAVMAFHFNPALLPGGFIGVDVFLVISGFLITSILLNKKAQPNYILGAALKYFYISRFKRIAPAYFIMLVVVAFLAAIFFIPEDFSTFKEGFQDALFFNSNNYFADFGDYFAPANHEQPLLHTWSLAVEIQFYLLAPLLVLLLPKRILTWVFLASSIALTFIAEYRMRAMGLEQATYYSLYARIPEFFAGCLVALHLSSFHSEAKAPKWLPEIGLFLILVAAIAQPRLGLFPGIAGLLPVLGCVLVLLGSPHYKSGQWLSNSSLVWVGSLSYSLYLWHWPVLAVLRYYTGEEVLDGFYGSVFVVLTITLSIISYYVIECPLRDNRQKKRNVFAYLALGAIVLGASQSLAGINQYYAPKELPTEYRRYADPEKICHGQIVGDCLRGDLSSSREVLVLGDSHAAMLNHFFDYLGKELRFKARVITASSCVTIPGFDYERLPKWAQGACVRQLEEAERYLANAQTIVLAGMWTYQVKSSTFQSVLSKFLNQMSESNVRIIVLSQVPLLKSNPLRTYRFDNIGMRSETVVKKSYEQANSKIKVLSENRKGVTFLDLSDLSLFSSPPFYNELLTYFDSHHLNEIGARNYAFYAVNEFRKILWTPSVDASSSVEASVDVKRTEK
ncbi:acyltransferase family protein [Pseudidiomarina sp.]|uniref:acyltransferase family protein n=1 Tax=Pseudidiomarina sp. TaxID=2081707 RepID=UPI00299EF1D1|nr:acyltransferase family protein [Pseudidiomarina sp.]MDX1706800.1 acyltransferase family protein [Pseudidiomarina sp.]